MRKLLLFVMIFLSCNNINSQTLKLGMTGDFLVGNKYLNYQVGPAFVIEYSHKNLPVSIQGSTKFYLAELSKENNFSFGFTYSVLSISTSINYCPINWDIKPYIGVGIAYNFNKMNADGNPTFTNGAFRSQSNLDNNFSVEINGGLQFSANTPINFIVEISRTFNRPEYDLVIFENYERRVVGKNRFDFDSLFLKLGLLFQI